MGSLENKLVILLISTFLICGTILYLILFWVLWPYRVAVAISLLFCIATLIGVLCYVHARGRLIEQDVRMERYEYNREIPLDTEGEPLYWPEGVQENPYRSRQTEPVVQQGYYPAAAHRQEKMRTTR